jgi:hypothetical protein
MLSEFVIEQDVKTELSLQERVRLAGGEGEIHLAPGHGMEIRARFAESDRSKPYASGENQWNANES